MTTTNETLPEILRIPKYQFRKVENLPGKARRHRYERRKMKEIVRLGDWQGEDAA